MAEHRQKTALFIDPVLWRALRVRALQEGITATALLNRLIAEFLDRTAPQAGRRAAKKGR